MADTLSADKGAPLPAPLPRLILETARPQDWTELVTGLKSFGFDVQQTDQSVRSLPGSPVVRIADGTAPSQDAKSPFIVVTKARSVEGLKSAVESGASGYFSAPFEFLSLASTLCAAAAKAREQAIKANESLNADQTISTVVGILMERYRFPRIDAYERLRRYSRAERRKVVDVAGDIVRASEELSRTLRAIEAVPKDGT